MPARIEGRARNTAPGLALALIGGLLAGGCGGEPSRREVENARAFEALLTAVSLKHEREVERDAALIDRRHAAGEMSDANYRTLAAIIAEARAKHWADAERRAYAFRARFGERGSFFE